MALRASCCSSGNWLSSLIFTLICASSSRPCVAMALYCRWSKSKYALFRPVSSVTALPSATALTFEIVIGSEWTTATAAPRNTTTVTMAIEM